MGEKRGKEQEGKPTKSDGFTEYCIYQLFTLIAL